MSSKKSLLLGSQGDYYWSAILRSALDECDRILEIVSAARTSSILWGEYDLVILDAGATANLTSVISLIREQNPEAQIIVFSPSPAWKEAREAMLAGAVDYALKSLDEADILSTLRKNLDRQSPATPPQETQ